MSLEGPPHPKRMDLLVEWLSRFYPRARREERVVRAQRGTSNAAIGQKPPALPTTVRSGMLRHPNPLHSTRSTICLVSVQRVARLSDAANVYIGRITLNGATVFTVCLHQRTRAVGSRHAAAMRYRKYFRWGNGQTGTLRPRASTPHRPRLRPREPDPIRTGQRQEHFTIFAANFRKQHSHLMASLQAVQFARLHHNDFCADKSHAPLPLSLSLSFTPTLNMTAQHHRRTHLESSRRLHNQAVFPDRQHTPQRANLSRPEPSIDPTDSARLT